MLIGRDSKLGILDKEAVPHFNGKIAITIYPFYRNFYLRHYNPPLYICHQSIVFILSETSFVDKTDFIHHSG